MAYTTYLDNALLGHAVGKTAYTMPTNYMALFTAAPTAAGGGTEAAYTNYARVAASVDMGSPSAGSVTNSAAINFPACGATGASIVAFGAYDAPTGGNLLYFGTCTLAVSSGITPSFAAGALTVSQT
jgi:hypothetical protein